MDDSGYRGSQIRTNQIPFGRNDLAQQNANTSQNLWDAVGYPGKNDLDNFEWHRIRYERQSEAAGLIDKFSADTWGSDSPTVEDDADRKGEQTEFERQCELLFSGETLRRQPGQRLLTADRLGMLGRYAVVVFGFKDAGKPSQPISEGQFGGLEDLNFIHVYDEGRVSEIEKVEDFSKPRFGLPKSYTIQVAEDLEKDFHHTRCVHVALGTTLTGDDLHGNYFLKNIAHELVNIDKIKAGAAEGYWRGHYQGLVIRPPEDENGVPVPLSSKAGGGDGSGDGGQDGLGSDSVARQVEDYDNQYERVIATTGTVEPLDSNIEDPTNHLESQFRSISASKDVPLSIMLGNERGDIATSEDRAMYHETLAGRRNRIAKPLILRPVINRLDFAGILPEPIGGGYSVHLPPLEEITALERAEIFAKFAEGAKNLTGGQTDLLASWAEYRNEWLDWGEERGSEADTEQPLPSVPANGTGSGSGASGSGDTTSNGTQPSEPTSGMDEGSEAVTAQAARMNITTPAGFATDGGQDDSGE